jgi:undecaprenyl-diphosphatase
MKIKINKNKKIIIVTLSLLIFFIILRDVFIYEVTSYDNWAYGVFVENLRSDNMTIFMKSITFCGSGLALFIIISLLLIKNRKNGLTSLLNLSIIFILNSIIKIIVQRPRPSGYNLIVESNYSFPSGHSMVAMAFYGYIVYMIYKHEKPSTKKYLKIVGLLFVIFMIGLSRIYLGVHYASDVLAGFMLSISYLMLFIIFSPKILDLLNIRSKKNEKKTKKTN